MKFTDVLAAGGGDTHKIGYTFESLHDRITFTTENTKKEWKKDLSPAT
jgi:hypothetical protein